MSALRRIKLVISAAILAAWCVSASGDPRAVSRVRAFAKLPNWSGIWQSTVWPVGISGRPPGNEAQLRSTRQLIRRPPYNTEWASKYDAAMRDTATLQARNATFKVCTRSVPALMEAPWMFQVAVLPEETLFIFENGQVRHVYTDNRKHPGEDDLWPTPLGDSVGHWEGQTLVVDTIARTASEPLAPRAWASMLSDRAHFIERVSQVDPNHLRDELTIDDLVSLSAPWHITLEYTRVPELNRIIPTDCNENERNPVLDGKMIITKP